MAFGVALWSLLTAATGMAKGFWMLLLPRIFIGVGESILTPTAISYMSDYFPKTRMGFVAGFYYIAVPLGVALSFFIAGYLGPIWGWRNCFYALGALGLILALVTYFFKESDKRTEELLLKHDETIFNMDLLTESFSNAGVASTVLADGIWELDDKDWEWVLGVNFYGTLYGLQSFVPHMIKHKEEGHVLNTISLAGILPGEAIYGVSKHAALALSESLWQGLRNAKSSIGASVLCPGFVNTNIIESNRNRPDHLSSANKTNFIWIGLFHEYFFSCWLAHTTGCSRLFCH